MWQQVIVFSSLFHMRLDRIVVSDTDHCLSAICTALSCPMVRHTCVYDCLPPPFALDAMASRKGKPASRPRRRFPGNDPRYVHHPRESGWHQGGDTHRSGNEAFRSSCPLLSTSSLTITSRPTLLDLIQAFLGLTDLENRKFRYVLWFFLQTFLGGWGWLRAVFCARTLWIMPMLYQAMPKPQGLQSVRT